MNGMEFYEITSLKKYFKKTTFSIEFKKDSFTYLKIMNIEYGDIIFKSNIINFSFSLLINYECNEC